MTKFLVLDSMYYREANIAGLEALRARGFRIALPCFGFEEVWAKSTRESAMGILLKPLLRIAPYLDPHWPVLPAGKHLAEQLKARSRRKRRSLQNRFSARFRFLVEYIARTRTIADEAWTRAGALANADIDEGAKQHLETAARVLATDFPGIGGKTIAELMPETKRLFAGVAGVEDAAERLDAHLAAEALEGLHAAKKTPNRAKPKENDAEDFQMLQHIAFPSFVATKDVRLIGLVDESGTHQAPWVRTMVELIEDELPDGKPWGSTAREQAARFVRPTAKERREREAALLATLRGEAAR